MNLDASRASGHAAHGNQRPAAGGSCDRLSFVIRDRTTPTAFRGFPWWLPLITALIGALVALAIASSATASWVADARLWIRSDVSESAGLSDALRDPASAADDARPQRPGLDAG